MALFTAETTAAAANIMDLSSAISFVPEIWSSLAVVQREASLVLGRLVDRKFEKGLTMGDTIFLPSVSDLSAQTKAENSVILFQSIIETKQTISINVHQYVAIAVESIAEVQADRDLLKLYAGKMGYALSKAVDTKLAELVDDLSQTVGVEGVANTDDELIAARRQMNVANVPKEGRFWYFHPSAEAELLKLDRFIHADYTAVHGSVADGLDTAYMGSFYRDPIYVSTNAVAATSGHDNGYIQKEALALIMQMTPTTRNQYDIDYFADNVAMAQIYGVKEIRDDHGVLVKGP